MGKNLVVCCDGTWNDPDELRGDVAEPTNVAKLALALAQNVDPSADGQAQHVHYVPGVGTAPGDHLLGGAFGVGISENIRDGYRFLIENYSPGDLVFLFGFSRGAYTARSLGGLIHNCGILRQDSIDQLDTAYAFYRDRTNKTHPRTIAAQIFRRDYSHEDSKVYFIGVWDTVGALGIPQGLPGWEQLSKDCRSGSSCGGFTTPSSARTCATPTTHWRSMKNAQPMRPHSGPETHPRPTNRHSYRSGSRAYTARSAAAPPTHHCQTSR